MHLIKSEALRARNRLSTLAKSATRRLRRNKRGGGIGDNENIVESNRRLVTAVPVYMHYRATKKKKQKKSGKS